MGKTTQKQVLNEMLANGGVLERAMKGKYSKAYIRSHNIKKTKSWQQLIEEELPDGELIRVNKEGLKADLVKTAQFEGSISDEKTYADYATRHKYLETAYKVKGKIQDINLAQVTNTQVNINFFSNPKVMEAAKQLDEAVKDYITNETKKPLETL